MYHLSSVTLILSSAFSIYFLNKLIWPIIVAIIGALISYWLSGGKSKRYRWVLMILIGIIFGSAALLISNHFFKEANTQNEQIEHDITRIQNQFNAAHSIIYVKYKNSHPDSAITVQFETLLLQCENATDYFERYVNAYHDRVYTEDEMKEEIISAEKTIEKLNH